MPMVLFNLKTHQKRAAPMQIVYHIGANCTDQDRLIKSVLKNADTFADHGIKVPGPSKYRRLIRETIQKLDGALPSAGTREVLLDAIIDQEHCNRIVMSNAKFICIHGRVFEKGAFYSQAEAKLRGLRDLFPDDELQICLAIRNPATFIPQIVTELKTADLDSVLDGVDPMGLRWSELITRIRAAVPGRRLNRLVQRGHALDLGPADPRDGRRGPNDPHHGGLRFAQHDLDPRRHEKVCHLSQGEPAANRDAKTQNHCGLHGTLCHPRGSGR